MKPSVLINAYAISPSWGSEQGVGWNWTINIAQFCEVFVITEGEWQREIEEALQTLPQKENMHFYYLPIGNRIRRMCWNQGDWRFYFHYAIWQRRALKLAKEIVAHHKIDIIHQLNMVGFRDPGFLWRIKGIPFVLGPICGFAPINLRFFSESCISTRLMYFVKDKLNWIQFRLHPRVRKAIKKASVIITPSSECSDLVFLTYGKKALIIPETGVTDVNSKTEIYAKKSNSLNLLWVGKFSERKKLDIAIRTLASVDRNSKCLLHIVGSGTDAEVLKYHKLAEKLGVNGRCIWYGQINHQKALEIMGNMDALFFTSILEATSTVVLEAIQYKLPVICHDCCGFGPIINDSIGRKIPMVNPEVSANKFSEIINDLAANRDLLDVMKHNFDNVASSLTYERKAELMYKKYQSLMRQHFEDFAIK